MVTFKRIQPYLWSWHLSTTVLGRNGLSNNQYKWTLNHYYVTIFIQKCLIIRRAIIISSSLFESLANPEVYISKHMNNFYSYCQSYAGKEIRYNSKQGNRILSRSPPEELINSEKIKQWESERYPSNQTSGHHE